MSEEHEMKIPATLCEAYCYERLQNGDESFEGPIEEDNGLGKDQFFQRWA
jgi:hypothetical protein